MKYIPYFETFVSMITESNVLKTIVDSIQIPESIATIIIELSPKYGVWIANCLKQEKIHRVGNNKTLGTNIRKARTARMIYIS